MFVHSHPTSNRQSRSPVHPRTLTRQFSSSSRTSLVGEIDLLPFMSKPNDWGVSVTSCSQRTPMKPKKRCRLKRRYSKTRSPADKLAYRSACHKASVLINITHSAYLRNEIEQIIGQPRMLWKAFRRLLHPGPGAAWYKGVDMDALATGLCDFFMTTVEQIKVKVDHSLWHTQ